MKNSGFEKGVKYWRNNISAPATADFLLDTLNVYRGKSALMVNVKTKGTNAWDVQLSQRDLSITNKTAYKVSFRAKTAGTTGQLNAAIIRTSDNVVYSVKTFQITNSWTLFELNFTANTNASVSFNIDFGAVAGKYYLDDFTLTTPELLAFNQIKNGDFEKTPEEWNFNTLSPAQATGTGSSGEYLISIGNAGVNVWDVHLGQSNILAEKGKEYTVTFDAYTAAPRSISVFVGKNSDPWNIYSGSHILSLTTSKKTFSFTFIMNETTDNLARFGFDVGASSSSVYIDNVFVSQGKIPTGINSEIQSNPDAPLLLRNYPNPFSQQTYIQYYLQKPTTILLKIVDITGKEIETLMNEYQEAGEHQVVWDTKNNPSGIYFTKLITSTHLQTIKIMLKK